MLSFLSYALGNNSSRSLSRQSESVYSPAGSSNVTCGAYPNEKWDHVKYQQVYHSFWAARFARGHESIKIVMEQMGVIKYLWNIFGSDLMNV